MKFGRQLGFYSVAALALATGSAGHAAAVGTQESREYIQAYATCAVRYNHDRAAQAILSDLGIDALEHRFSDIFVHAPLAYVAGCRELVMRFRVAVTMSGEPLRFALAEQLVAADFKDKPAAGLSQSAALTHRDPPNAEARDRLLASLSNKARRERVRSEYEAQLGLAWLSRYGECVVRSDPASSQAWIVAAEGSPAGDAALQALQPALGTCLRAGDQLKFSKEVLRGTLAVNYFRLAHAPNLSSPGKDH
ncbi:MAG: hypothetical protein ACKOOL_04490 [Novosphingobium sp.]